MASARACAGNEQQKRGTDAQWSGLRRPAVSRPGTRAGCGIPAGPGHGPDLGS